MNGDREVWNVLSFYFPRSDLVRQIEPLGGGGGWSGSRIWRLECADGTVLCLRRWPQGHPSPERLRLIHDVLARVAARGLTIVPAPLSVKTGETFVEFDSHHWELAPWMAGQADFHLRPMKSRLRSALEALAWFHEYAAPAEAQRDRPPCLADRESEFSKLRGGRLEEIVTAVARGMDPALDSRAQRILAAVRGRLVDLEALVRAARQQKLPLQPAIRDIHRDHVLFTGDDVTGIVDFGAMRVDTPLTDIARLVGSLVGDDQASRRDALEAYSRLRPLSDADCQLVDLLDETGLVLGVLNWLLWLYVEQRDMGEMEPIIRRLDEILARLEKR